jgi:hypothetical protein
MLPQIVVGCQVQQEQRNPHPSTATSGSKAALRGWARRRPDHGAFLDVHGD